MSSTVGLKPALGSRVMIPADSSTFRARPPLVRSLGMAMTSPSFSSSTEVILSENRLRGAMKVLPMFWIS